MDPEANLKEQLELAERLLNANDAEPPDTADAVRLAELVQALDAWIRSGGFLPRSWLGLP